MGVRNGLLISLAACLAMSLFCVGPSTATARLDAAKSKEIGDRAAQTPPSATESVSSLADYLTKPASDDLEKVRAIYEWIVRNIVYDVAAFDSGVLPDQDAEAVLKRRTAVCSGYARLFEALAAESGLEAKEVIGFSRGKGYSVGAGVTQKPDHAWTVAKIDGKWQLMDCTWAAGYIDAKNQFVRSRCEFYFLTPPEAFVYDHFPEDAQWQLTDKPMDRSEFEGLVYLRPAFFGHGLKLISHSQRVIKSDCCFDMSFGAPDDVVLNAQVLKGSQRDLASSLFIQRDGEALKLSTAFASPGDYTLRLFAKRSVGEEVYDWAADYLVEVQPSTESSPGFPVALSTFGEKKVTLHSPLAGRLKSGKTAGFKLTAPGAQAVAVVVEGKWSKLTQNGDVFEGEVAAGGDSVQVAAQYPGSESYYVLLKYAVVSE
jgi:hypothetical protein